MSCALGLLQKACLLGSARILRKILDTQGGLIWKRKRLKSGNVQQKIMNKSAVLWFDLVRGRLCAQPRSGWLVPSWKIRRFSRHFCCMFSLQSIIGSLNNQDGDDYKRIRATWNFIALIPTRSIRTNVGKIFLELNSKRLYQNSGREKESRCLVFTSSTQREIRDFHVVVMLRQQRNVQKTVMHVQSCFANVDGGEMATGDAINQARGLARKPLLSDKRDKEHAFLMRKSQQSGHLRSQQVTRYPHRLPASSLQWPRCK